MPQLDSSRAAHAKTLQALSGEWDARGVDPESLHFRRGTIVAERPASDQPSDGKSNWLRTLPALLDAGPEGEPAALRMGDVLGEGAMGIVRQAEQTSLERQVAVKAPRNGIDAQLAGPQLLLEARITGALEHPNVVPVYTLGRDPGNRPLIVMRRIEGTSWAERLAHQSSDGRAEDDYLNQHLRILKQVALAVHFAHSKGIIHRDLKPDNVMLGPYDEIYVVDWGIAVSVRSDGVPGVPLASAVEQIEGTPGYMAPEMAAADGVNLDERSDVYLLGAILHEVLTGEPPHQGAKLVEVLRKAFASEPPEYPASTPSGLRSICHRAMERFNEDRYPTARAFADAIDEYLENRDAMRLCDEAELRLISLTEGFASEDTSEEHGRELQNLFSECRFAFSHALRSWPENNAARDGLRQAITLMIEFELRRAAPGSAHALLRELPNAPIELVERVEAQWQEKLKRDERLAKLERDLDLNFGAKLRERMLVLVAVMWVLACVACGVLTRMDIVRVDHLGFAAVNAAFLCIIGSSVLITRKTMLGNAANRRLSAISSLLFAGLAMLWLLLGVIGVSLPHSTMVHSVTAATVWAAAAVAIESRWFVMSFAQMTSLAMVALFPEYHYELLGIVVGSGSVVATRLGALTDGSSDDKATSQAPTSREDSAKQS